MTLKATIRKEFTFAAAHKLIGLPPDHPCSNMHGHTYRIIVEVRGMVQMDGMVMDYRVIKNHVQPWIDQLDHSVLNDSLNGINPTSENIAAVALGLFPFLTAVEVYESPTTMCRMTQEGK
jgi:6-pyruvoyltetrahydropterin/6-carboxytetrahydropterin synthase